MKNTISINPPPSDRRCEKCGKHVSELKPFGGPGDPLVGDFTGTLLLKNYRSMYEGQPIEEYEKILSEVAYDIDNQTDNIKELEDKYGKELLDKVITYDQICNTISASWECRNCFIC
jgi:hypothetical protein